METAKEGFVPARVLATPTSTCKEKIRGEEEEEEEGEEEADYF